MAALAIAAGVVLVSPTPAIACSMGASQVVVARVAAKDGDIVTFEVVDAPKDPTSTGPQPELGALSVQYDDGTAKFLAVGRSYQISPTVDDAGAWHAWVGTAQDASGDCGYTSATYNEDGTPIDTSLIRFGPLNTKGWIVAIVAAACIGLALAAWRAWDDEGRSYRKLLRRH